MHKKSLTFVIIIVLACYGCKSKNNSFEFNYNANNSKFYLNLVEVVTKQNKYSIMKLSSPKTEFQITEGKFVKHFWYLKIKSKLHFYAFHGKPYRENSELYFYGNVIWDNQLHENIKCKIIADDVVTR